MRAGARREFQCQAGFSRVRFAVRYRSALHTDQVEDQVQDHVRCVWWMVDGGWGMTDSRMGKKRT